MGWWVQRPMLSSLRNQVSYLPGWVTDPIRASHQQAGAFLSAQHVPLHPSWGQVSPFRPEGCLGQAKIPSLRKEKGRRGPWDIGLCLALLSCSLSPCMSQEKSFSVPIVDLVG